MPEIAQPLLSFIPPSVPVTPADIENLLAVAPHHSIEIFPSRIDGHGAKKRAGSEDPARCAARKGGYLVIW